ncbi:hypothetical protein GQX74_014740 [Glossina fuscipes]|nr:hypothetical protein GQX74_014740 [Glossina fuscipes]
MFVRFKGTLDRRIARLHTLAGAVRLHMTLEDRLDALVNELKSGSVTLRRCRRKTGTNEALQEMFQILEISQQQNRQSTICINMNSPDEKETSIALTSNCNAKLSLTFFNT